MNEGDILVFYPPLLNRRRYFYLQKNVRRWRSVAQMMNVVVIRNDELGQRLAARIVGKLGGVREAEPCLAGRPLTRDELAGLAAKGRPLTEGVAVARRKRVERSVLKAKPKVRAISRRTRRGRRKGR